LTRMRSNRGESELMTDHYADATRCASSLDMRGGKVSAVEPPMPFNAALTTPHRDG
jgi:hypothetical protein